MKGGRGRGARAGGVVTRGPDMALWKGRVDPGEGERALRWHQVVGPESPDLGPGGVALVGFACEAGVARNGGRPGASGGPASLRAALGGLAWHGGAALLDAGDVVVTGDALEEGQAALAAVVTGLLRRERLPVVMGGGHETALGTMQGLVARLEETHPMTPPVLGVINLDAHLDLRPSPRPTSGTSFRDMALLCQALGWDFRYLCVGVSRAANTPSLFDTARELGAAWVEDVEAGPGSLDGVKQVVRDFLEQVDHLHLSVDLDVLPGWVAPGVSAPSAQGADPSVVEGVVKEVASCRRLRSVDISELSPPHDIDGRTARVGARLMWTLASSLEGG